MPSFGLFSDLDYRNFGKIILNDIFVSKKSIFWVWDDFWADTRQLGLKIKYFSKHEMLMFLGVFYLTLWFKWLKIKCKKV